MGHRELNLHERRTIEDILNAKIPVRDTVADIEKHSVKDHALREMVLFEINRHGWVLVFKLKRPYPPRAS